MKSFIVLIALHLFIINASSQNNYIPTGTWKWVNGTDTIIIVLKPAQVAIDGHTLNVLYGFHRYIKTGVIVESTLEYQNTSYTDKKYSIAMFSNGSSRPRIDGLIDDITLRYKQAIIFTKIAPGVMNVRVTSSEGRRPNGWVYGFTLPRNFQLTQ